MNDLTRSSIGADIGLSSGRTLVPAASPIRGELVRQARELDDRTDTLLSAGAPETLLQKVVDAIAPSPVRAEKRRFELELVRERHSYQLELQKVVKAAKLAEMRALAQAHETACRLEASARVAALTVAAHEQVDALIETSGRAFDQDIDRSVDHALQLQSQAARESASDRIALRRDMARRTNQAAHDVLMSALDSNPLPARR